MDAVALRALQAPLKQSYRDDPSRAQVLARAEARLDAEGIACRVPTPFGDVIAGLHPAGGGDGSQACAADMVLQALVACAGTTLRAVATASGVTLLGGSIRAEGRWDARGTLGVDRAVPVGITDIVLRFELDTDAGPERVKRLIEATERYCVVLQTLRVPPRIEVAA